MYHNVHLHQLGRCLESVGAIAFLKMEDNFQINLSKFQWAAELNSFAKICESLLGCPGLKFHHSEIYQ